MYIVVFIQSMKEFADLLPLLFGQLWEYFENVADFAGDDWSMNPLLRFKKQFRDDSRDDEAW